MIISLLSIATNYVLNWTFVRALGFGHLGLALATSAVATGNCALLYLLLHRRIGPFGAQAAATLARITVATGLMAAAVAAVDAALAGRLPAAATAQHALRLAATVPVALAVFWAACRALRVPLPDRLLRRRTTR
jgi:peptidoglycan biosynthesis protein MviN/MurJ (putative lipid II flippase)